MNNDIITVTAGEIAGEAVQMVSLRDLHAFLEVKKQLSHWARYRIEQYGLVGGRNFIVFNQNGLKWGRLTTEYHCPIDIAKKLSMCENNHRGKEARQYFIECEKRAKEAAKKEAVGSLEFAEVGERCSDCTNPPQPLGNCFPQQIRNARRGYSVE